MKTLTARIVATVCDHIDFTMTGELLERLGKAIETELLAYRELDPYAWTAKRKERCPHGVSHLNRCTKCD